MAGPWEQYRSPESDGPWAQYAVSARDRIENDAISTGAKEFAKDGIGAAYLSALGGAVRGAADIGSTILDQARKFGNASLEGVPQKMRVGGPQLTREDRLQGVDAALAGAGVDPNSIAYSGGKLGAQIAGTAGVGGAIAAPLRAIGSPLASGAAAALESGGFSVPGLTGAPAMAARMAAGGVTGGAAAGLIDPNAAGTGAAIGAVLPPAMLGAGRLGDAITGSMQSGARSLMKSAIKPTIAQQKSGDAAIAIDTMLKNGISPNAKGVEKLKALIDDADQQIANAIGSSTAQIDKQKVLGALVPTRAQFGNQVAPQADLNAIQAAQDAFLAHPQFPGATIPVQQAQELKQGTYRVLAKKYGQLGSADTEAQKAIARGLKDEIAAAVPGVGQTNTELSKLIATLDVAQRRALMEGNKNPIGLAALAPTPTGLLAFLADRSAAMKAMGARAMYSAAPLPAGLGLLQSPLLPYGRAGLLAVEANP